MTALSIQPPFPTFSEADGSPLEDGYIWIGTANLNPITNPIAVYWDAALTQPAAQPIRTQGGYPANSGTPARLYVNSDYSIQVQNRNGSVVYSAPAATERLSGVVIEVDSTDVSFIQAGTGAVTRTAQAKMRDVVSVKDFGAVGDGVTDDTAAIQAALNSGANGVYIPGGTYRIESTLVVDGNTGTTATHIYGDGGFSTQLAWYGSAGGTMLVVGKEPRQMTRFEGVYFNARQLATKIAHIGVSTTTVAVVRNMTFEQCLFMDARTGTAIWLGDYTASPAIADADIANFNIVRCQFFNNNHSVTWDSIQALGVNIDGCFMSRSGSGIFIGEQLYMERGGSASVINTYFGGIPTGALFAIYVKDGWINVKNCEFEFGIGSGSGGGTLWLDTPALSISSTGIPSSIQGCRIVAPGVNPNVEYIRISSNNHPLVLIGNSFAGKSGGALATYAIRNPGLSRIVSINNRYLGYFWDAPTSEVVVSLNDTYNNGSIIQRIAPKITTYTEITSANSPYTVAADDDFIISASGACTVNLPLIGQPYLNGSITRRLTIKRTSPFGTTSVVAAAGNTIDGLAQVDLNQNQDSTIVLESDGFSKWLIVAFYSPGNQSAGGLSTGVGSVKMANANSADNTGWLEITPGKYVPYWSDITP